MPVCQYNVWQVIHSVEVSWLRLWLDDILLWQVVNLVRIYWWSVRRNRFWNRRGKMIKNLRFSLHQVNHWASEKKKKMGCLPTPRRISNVNIHAHGLTSTASIFIWCWSDCAFWGSKYVFIVYKRQTSVRLVRWIPTEWCLKVRCKTRGASKTRSQTDSLVKDEGDRVDRWSILIDLFVNATLQIHPKALVWA